MSSAMVWGVEIGFAYRLSGISVSCVVAGRLPNPPPAARLARLEHSIWTPGREIIRPVDFRPVPCKASRLHIECRHRKWISEPLESCRYRAHHVRCALRESLPLSSENPLPSETLRDIEFTRRTPGDQVRKIWDVQLRAAGNLVRSRALGKTKGDARSSGPIAAAAGKFQTVAAKHLLRHLNIGGLTSSPTVFRLPGRYR